LWVVIGGGAITLIGLAFLFSAANSFFTDFPLAEMIIAGEEIFPQNSISHEIPIQFEEELYLAINSFPDSGSLAVKLTDASGIIVKEKIFEGQMYESVGKLENGTYQFTITNTGDASVTVFVALTAHDIEENFNQILPLASTGIVGFLLIGIGIIVIVIGTILFFVKRSNTVKK